MKKFLLSLFLIPLCFIPNVVLGTETVNINTASLAQLDTLTGIGPVYAQRIIDSRPFSSVDDLDRVKGIGPATLQKIKTQGLACVNCVASDIPPAITEPLTPVLALIATTTYPSGVYINELVPNPEGADETDEWIELYNSNNFEVDLSNWQLQDATGTVTTHTIPQNTKILANAYLTFSRPAIKIMLNNDGDGINLLTPDKKIVDSMSFVSAPLGQSYYLPAGRQVKSSSWLWSTTLTPGFKNIIPAAKTLPKAKNSVKNEVVAGISQSTNPNRDTLGFNGASPWALFFTVLAVTIILAIIVLLIKLRFLKPKT